MRAHSKRNDNASGQTPLSKSGQIVQAKLN